MREYNTKLKDASEALLVNLGEVVDLALALRDKYSEGIAKADEFYELTLEAIRCVTDIQERIDTYDERNS